jgi:hypothetical protein
MAKNKTAAPEQFVLRLYLCNMIWREFEKFSSGPVCMVLASAKYDEADYYRNYVGFICMRWSTRK